MEEDNSTDDSDVFKLITSLCERFHNDPLEVKISRVKCYEILLGKRIPKYKKNFRDLKGTTDPLCNLLSWQFQLTHLYNMRSHAVELQECVNILQKCYGSDTEGFNSILKFLLSLRNIPLKDNKKLDLASLPPITGFKDFNKLFEFPILLSQESDKSSDAQFAYRKSTLNKNESIHNTDSLSHKYSDIFKDEGYYSPPKSLEQNIWEIASKAEYSHRRNWESYGYPEPDKERPFMSELGDLSSLWVENLESLYMFKLFRDSTVFNSRMISRKAFIKDLKYLLVGMASDSFNVDKCGQFYLMPNLNVEGITPDTLNMFCRNLTFCGTCFNALKKMSTPNPETAQYKYQGYIFMEFCESINSYLKFYQTAVFSIPDCTNFLQFHEKTYQLQLQIATISSICKVGPYTKLEDIPHGVALLNYLYQKILSLTEQKVIIALLSILYPCCQIYFSRFLKQWIMEGIINDPYGEFFIKSNSKYILSRGRTYWTRSYVLVEDIMPDFLVDSGLDILACGKAMNLLKFCHTSSKLCLYLMGKKPPIISCCFSLNQLAALQEINTNYYLDVSADCGPRFNFDHVLLKCQDEDPIFMSLLAKKRAATLKRIELERLKLVAEQHEKRVEEINMLKEQYEISMEQKQLKIVKEIQEEMEQILGKIIVEEKRQKLIQEEANNMMEFYGELIETAEKRKCKIENHIKASKIIQVDLNVGNDDKDHFKSTENLVEKSISSTDSFYSVYDDGAKEFTKEDNIEDKEEPESQLHSSESMDIINANTSSDNLSDKKITVSANIQQAIDNFEIARKNKYKVMTEEMGIEYIDRFNRKPLDTHDVANLTDAQRNKLKVLSSEFGIDVQTFKVNNLSAAAQLNRNKVLGISDCFQTNRLDNESYVNKNLNNDDHNKVGNIKKSQSLILDFDRTSTKSSKSEFDKPIPMSVDSTPLSDLPESLVTTPSTVFMSIDTNQLESVPSTAETQQTNQEFNFNQNSNRFIPIYYNQQQNISRKTTAFSKRVTKEEAKGISTTSLKLFLHQSIQIPLVIQTKLVNDELLKYFINELHYLDHLTSLKDFFFLQDGEFGRNITEKLFSKLYSANFPTELINYRTLQDLVFGAFSMSGKNQGNSHCLSFKINSLPQCFDLGNPDVLGCLSLTYKVKWPLNILLPSDTIGKYDEVFKFLLKLNRVSWVLKKIFLELKVLAKETGKNEIYLMSSPQYRRLHQCRHVMTHFVQTLQNYVVGEVLQSSWELFMKNLSNVTNLDELYVTHTTYIKNILFMCILNQKTAVLRNVIHKIFVVILKFFDYLRSRTWTCEDGSYIHPNFNKLESIFKNFEEFVAYFFKVARKVVKCGYQPHLFQLLDMLDVNNYISNSLKKTTI